MCVCVCVCLCVCVGVCVCVCDEWTSIAVTFNMHANVMPGEFPLYSRNMYSSCVVAFATWPELKMSD